MTILRYAITASSLEGQVEFTPRGDRATARFHEQEIDVEGQGIGSAWWTAARATTRTQEINHISLREADGEGRLVAMIIAVLEGAHAVWTVFYRADKAASCFRTLGNRQRIPDALDLAFTQLASEIFLPHKP